MSASLGADTLTIQYNDSHKHCNPNLATFHYCDYYIGVYGWNRVASYTIVVVADSSFNNESSIVHLHNGIPQTGLVATGRYAYYEYVVDSTGMGVVTIISITVGYIKPYYCTA
jgi:hypothetical protein